jgi:hypothetical protein
MKGRKPARKTVRRMIETILSAPPPFGRHAAIVSAAGAANSGGVSSLSLVVPASGPAGPEDDARVPEPVEWVRQQAGLQVTTR